MDSESLSGPLKAAILIHSLDEETAQELLEILDRNERELMEDYLQETEGIPPKVREKVIYDFLAMMGRVPASAGGNAGTGEIAGEGTAVSPESSLALLRSKEPDELAMLIKDEHPQTIAVILLHLPAEHAAGVLAELPDETASDVAFRISSTGKYASEMVEEMQHVFTDILKRNQSAEPSETGGLERLAEILNLSDKSVSETIMKQLETHDPLLVSRIRQLMFVFEDIVFVDDRGLQQTLRRADSKDVAIALKAASGEVKEKVFRNMSKRAGDMLREEMESLGPVRMKDVEASQQIILNIIKELEEDGSLIIRRGTGDEFVE
ncbi:MAG: flagellar motor switch protein FliG [Desulfococcaceae bacterium]|jgi:flagellar motor switch protein FliG|nr:flagellar motor switch protein FliG [Desulfococcaceae bacterium]